MKRRLLNLLAALSLVLYVATPVLYLRSFDLSPFEASATIAGGKFRIVVRSEWGALRIWERHQAAEWKIHYWKLAVLLLFAPVAWLYSKSRRAYRIGLGQCPECGYDLRASKDRCPECGAAIPAAGEPPQSSPRGKIPA